VESLTSEHADGAKGRVSDHSSANPTVQANILKVRVEGRSSDGHVHGFVFRFETSFKVDVLGLVLDANHVFSVELPSVVAGKAVSLVGHVLDLFGDAVEDDIEMVGVELARLERGVLAGGEVVVALVHLVDAQLAHGGLAHVLALALGAVQEGDGVDLGGGLVDLLAERDGAHHQDVGLGLHGGHEVGEGDPGNVGFGAHDELLFLLVGGLLAEVHEDASVVADLALGGGGGGHELGARLALEGRGQVNYDGIGIYKSQFPN